MQGKVVLVTGAAKRVGAEISRHLHALGANVMIHYHNSERAARRLQRELDKARPGSAAVVRHDLLECDRLTDIVDATIRHFGHLDAVVNNASSFYPTPLGSITEDHWLDLVGTNMKAPLFLAQAAASALTLRGGCIVNIADIHAERPLEEHLVYSISKSGLVGLTKALARELAPHVRVNAIAPGPILWPEQNVLFDEVSRQRIVSHTPLKRIGEPLDIARTVAFLVDDAPYITGQVIGVDGGRSVRL